MFPLIDLVVRLFIRFGLIEQDAFFQKHNFFSKIRRLQIHIIGYKIIEEFLKIPLH
jgi:hypothetical protein